jgi:hypothetical protein
MREIASRNRHSVKWGMTKVPEGDDFRTCPWNGAIGMIASIAD